MIANHRRSSFVAIAALGLTVLGLGGAVIFQQLTRARISHEITEERQSLSKMRKDLMSYAKWSKDYRALSTKLGCKLPECNWADQMPFMVSQLTAVIESRGVRIGTLKPEPMTATKSILRFPLRIGMRTDLRKLVTILKDMDKMTPILAVERLGIRNDKEKSKDLQIDMTISSFVVLDKRAPVVKRRAFPMPVKIAEKKSGKAKSGDDKDHKAAGEQAPTTGPSVAATMPTEAATPNGSRPGPIPAAMSGGQGMQGAPTPPAQRPPRRRARRSRRAEMPQPTTMPSTTPPAGAVNMGGAR